MFLRWDTVDKTYILLAGKDRKDRKNSRILHAQYESVDCAEKHISAFDFELSWVWGSAVAWWCLDLSLAGSLVEPDVMLLHSH